jgi:uncharacterized protein (TIGR00730 family)
VKRICVFCGSSRGRDPRFAAASEEVGREIAARGIALVYGGGRRGLMGLIADAALAAGGEVIGVIPEAMLPWEVAHEGLTELRVVASMHERKAMMAELSDGFIALPGGYGTLEEFCEVVTWAQLGIHAKPCALLNVAGFYDPILLHFDRCVEEGLFRADQRPLVLDDDDVSRLLDRMAVYQQPETAHKLELDES